MTKGELPTRRAKVVVGEPDEVAAWRKRVVASGPRKGQPKTRPPVLIIGASGMMVVNVDEMPVAYVASRYAEVVRAAIEGAMK